MKYNVTAIFNYVRLIVNYKTINIFVFHCDHCKFLIFYTLIGSWIISKISTNTVIHFNYSTYIDILTGPIENLFNNRIVVPLGRLSYAIYIVNITVMTIIENKQRVTVYPPVDFIVSKYARISYLLLIISVQVFAYFFRIYGWKSQTNNSLA